MVSSAAAMGAMLPSAGWGDTALSEVQQLHPRCFASYSALAALISFILDRFSSPVSGGLMETDEPYKADNDSPLTFAVVSAPLNTSNLTIAL